jgi:predicted nucleic acid-binding protein
LKVLVDTSVWSLVLRQGNEGASTIRHEVESLILDHRVVMIGSIRQELLSGIRSSRQFDTLRRRFSAFQDESIVAADYEEAARLFNVCRQNGIQGSNTNFLICAVAIRNQFEIFTTDNDFNLFSELVVIPLYKMEKGDPEN